MSKFLLNFKITHKLWGGFGLVVLVLGVMSISTLISLLDVQKQVREMVDERQPTALLSEEMASELQQTASALGFYLMSKEDRHQTSLLDGIRRVSDMLGQLRAQSVVANDAEAMSLVQGIASDVKQFESMQDAIVAAASKYETNFPGIAYANSNINPLSRQLMQLTQQMIMSELDQEASEDRKELFNDITELRYSWSNVMNGIRGYLAFRTESTLQDMELYMGRVAELTGRIGETGDLLTFEQQDSLEQFNRIFAGFKGHKVKLQEIHSGERWRTDAWLVASEVAPLFASIKQKVGQLVTRQKEAIAHTSGVLQADTDNTLKVVGILALVGLFFGVLIAWVIGRVIAGPIRMIATVMSDIAQGEGDLTRHLDYKGKDELAELVGSFNQFVDKIHRLVRQTAASTNEVISTVTMTADNTSLITQQVLDQERETAQVAGAVDQMSETVSEVARNASTADEAAREADREASVGRTLVSESAASIQALADEVQSAAVVIQNLEKDSEQIGGVLDVIKGIAEQTNLLALNAAIEAARAGEQGRGFAVVADEVRNLATRTQQSTGEIEQMIARLQNGSREAVTVMEQGRRNAEANVGKATQAKQSLDQITAAIKTISSMNGQIATAAEQQSNVAAEISNSVANINQAIKGTADSARQTKAVTDHLGELASGLQKVVGHFKIASDSGFDFEVAKSAHLAWRARLRGFLDGKTSLSRTQVLSHRDCDLGKWFYSEGLRAYGHIQAVKDLEVPHQRLHDIIHRIVELKEGHNEREAETLFQEIEPLSAEIISLLDQANREVMAH